MKNKYRHDLGNLIFSLLVVVPSLLFGQSGKPDLIITNVELKYVRPNHIHKPGAPARGSDNLPWPKFFITVKNIGNEDFSDAFYIAYTNDARDIRIGRYSHLTMVNTGKYAIKVNHSLVLQIGGSYGNENYFKFNILSNSKTYDGYVLPIIDEANYDNNTYECSFPNFKK